MAAFRCILCEQERGRSVMEDGGAEHVALWRCESCRLVQLHPAPSVADCVESYEEAGHYAEETLRFEANVLDRDRAQVAELVRAGVRGPVLDVGAGAGTFVQAAREHDLEVRAVELARPSAAALRARHGIEVFDRPLEQLDLGATRFGLIVFSHSLEHVARPGETLRAAARWLEPGGHVHVAVPHWQSLRRWLGGRETPWIFPGHVSYFTAATLRDTARRAGLEASTVTTRPFVGRDYRFAIGLLRRLGLEGVCARFLMLREPRLDGLIGDDLQLDCPPWRFRMVLGLVHGLLGLLDDRLPAHLGCGEELRMTARRPA